MIDLGRLGSALGLDAEGIWIARGTPPVSYPEGGHSACQSVEDDSFWFRHRNRCVLACVRRFGQGADGPFFDVGAGNGYVARGLEGLGLEVVAIEPGAEGARNARRRGLTNVICATTDVCGFAPGVAGAIGAFDVVEHIQDDKRFLLEMRRLLASGGRLFVTVPAYAALWSAEDQVAGHYRRHTQKSIVQAIRGAGFEVEYATYFFRWLVLPIVLLRVLPYRLGLRRRGGDEARNACEHGKSAPGAASLLERLLGAEVAQIERGRTFGFGASVLVVARRGSGEHQ